MNLEGLGRLAVKPSVQGWLVLKFVGCSLENQPTLVNQNDPIRYLRHLLKNMSGKENCFPQSLDRFPYLQHLVGVQTGCRFVHDQNFRFMQQYIRHAYALAETTRKLADRLVEDGLQGALIDYMINPLTFLLRIHAPGVSEKVK